MLHNNVRNKSSLGFSAGSAFDVVIDWIFLSGTSKNPQSEFKKSFTKVGAKTSDLLRTNSAKLYIFPLSVNKWRVV
ncbi:hypothetical protein HYY69_02860 [Candidatus Woesearchaeota archaeon]|nr:hypothetical protein [Candidatus Woesearchaeota archaeon]